MLALDVRGLVSLDQAGAMGQMLTPRALPLELPPLTDITLTVDQIRLGSEAPASSWGGGRGPHVSVMLTLHISYTHNCSGYQYEYASRYRGNCTIHAWGLLILGWRIDGRRMKAARYGRKQRLQYRTESSQTKSKQSNNYIKGAAFVGAPLLVHDLPGSLPQLLLLALLQHIFNHIKKKAVWRG